MKHDLIFIRCLFASIPLLHCILRRITPLALLLPFAACVVPPIPYDRTATPELHHIAVLSPGFRDQPTVFVAASPGRSFGLIGALIDAGVQAKRESRFTEAIGHTTLKPRQEFTDALLTAIAAQGYSVQLIPITHPEEGFATDYKPAAGAIADAWLDCYAGSWGYLAAGTADSTPYRPMLAARCQLVRPSDHKVLMRDTVWYNPLSPVGSGAAQVVTIAPDPRFVFTTSDDLDADPARAAEGVRTSITAVTGAIGKLLQ